MGLKGLGDVNNIPFFINHPAGFEPFATVLVIPLNSFKIGGNKV